MDLRDQENTCDKWYDSFDSKTMQFTVHKECECEEDCTCEEITIPAMWDVCGLCGGKGSHVNPSIDRHGLSAEDFQEDPEFAESYFGGAYDVNCYRCNGRTTEPVVDELHCSPEQLELINDLQEAIYYSVREREYEMKYEY